METKEICYRGVIIFSIPKHWVEEYEPEGGGMFYEDGPNTGTLRLNVTTATSPTEITADSAVRVLVATKVAKTRSDVELLSDGNALAKSLIRTQEQNQELSMYCWHIANPVPPEFLRIANFTYTVLAQHESKTRTLAEVELLDRLIRKSRFHNSIGR